MTIKVPENIGEVLVPVLGTTLPITFMLCIVILLSHYLEDEPVSPEHVPCRCECLVK